MKKRIISYGLFALAALLLFFLMQLPAKQLYPRLASWYPVPLKLYQLSGSVWHGQAGAALIGGRRLEQLQWQLHPLALLLGRLESGIAARQGAGRLQTVIGRALNGNLYLHALTLRIPLADADTLLNSSSPLGLNGHLQIDLQQLELAKRRLVAADGLVRIDDAGLGPPINTKIGSYTLTLSTTAEGAIKGILVDQGGPLQLNGLLQLKPDGHYKLTATLALRDTSRKDLQRTLRYFGTPGPDGRVSIVRSGKFDLATLDGML